MIDYFITDESGLITHLGTCQAELLEHNTSGLGLVHIGIAPPGRWRFCDGEFISAEPPVTYVQQRQLEYPPMQDFADALYWQSKGDDSKMVAYIAACDEVKRKYPKI